MPRADVLGKSAHHGPRLLTSVSTPRGRSMGTAQGETKGGWDSASARLGAMLRCVSRSVLGLLCCALSNTRISYSRSRINPSFSCSVKIGDEATG